MKFKIARERLQQIILVDRFELSLNRAAEDAAKEANLYW